MGSYCFYRASRPLRKGRSGVLPSTEFETMASPDTGVVYFTEYLSVLFQLTYLNELYRECNGTTRAYVNSGYQALFSAITERLGTRLDFVSKFNLQQNGHHWNAPFVLITTVQIAASYLIPSPRYPSLVPRPFWEGETAWQLPRVQTVYGRNVTAIAYLIQAVKST